jgi:hypothetical protein
MSTCIDISLPTPQIPTLPNINPALTISFPPGPIPLGIPCCMITITGLSIPIPISAILAPLLTDIALINAAITAANVAIAVWIKSLPALEIPTCPFNGAVV